MVDTADSAFESGGRNTPGGFVEPEVIVVGRPATKVGLESGGGLVVERESSAVVVFAASYGDGLAAEIEVVEGERVGFTCAESASVDDSPTAARLSSQFIPTSHSGDSSPPQSHV